MTSTFSPQIQILEEVVAQQRRACAVLAEETRATCLTPD
jgi:hypothetical protein